MYMSSHEVNDMVGRNDAFPPLRMNASMDKAQGNSSSQNRIFEKLSRDVLNPTSVETVYRAGYTTITVRSRFDGNHAFADLIRELALHRLMDSQSDIKQDDL